MAPLPLLVLLFFCAGCQQASNTSAAQVLTAAQLGEQEILPNSEQLLARRYAAADLERGARVAMQCRAFHSFDPNPPTTAVITTPDRCGFILSDAARFALPPNPPTATVMTTPDRRGFILSGEPGSRFHVDY